MSSQTSKSDWWSVDDIELPDRTTSEIFMRYSPHGTVLIVSDWKFKINIFIIVISVIYSFPSILYIFLIIHCWCLNCPEWPKCCKYQILRFDIFCQITSSVFSIKMICARLIWLNYIKLEKKLKIFMIIILDNLVHHFTNIINSDERFLSDLSFLTSCSDLSSVFYSFLMLMLSFFFSAYSGHTPYHQMIILLLIAPSRTFSMKKISTLWQ